MSQNQLREEHPHQRHGGEDQPGLVQDGVDRTLIRWMLSLTPAERLQTLQQTVQSITSLRDGRPGT